MKKKISDITINYKVIENGTKNILFLHGWGANLNSFLPVAKELKCRSFLIDLPGFGESSLPNSIYSSYDYANLIERFINELNLDSLILVGHSFGGKIASLIASKNPSWLEKVVIISSPGIKTKKKFKTRLKIFTYKLLAKIFYTFGLKKSLEKLRNKFGSQDYKSSKGIMREILKNVINEDISTELKKIKKDTLIIFGKNDDAVPVEVGIKFNQYIENSKLIVYENAGHFPFLENFDSFLYDLKKFIGEINNG